MPHSLAIDPSERQPIPAAYEPAPLMIHIGFHKTGSTWLQESVFNDSTRGFTTTTGAPRHRLVEDFVTPDPLAYDPAAVAARYAGALDQAHHAGNTLILSHERLSGYPSSGGRDRALIAERLRVTFPQARILIVIREQRALIESMYRQHITDGGVESLSHFLQTPEPALCRKPHFTLDLYAFDRLIAYYHHLFGAGKVLVLPVEELARNPQAFVNRIAGFCGHGAHPVGAVKRSNERRPMIMQQVQRPLNFLFYHNELSPGALVHIPRFHKRYARLHGLFGRLSPPFIEARMARHLRHAVAAHVGDHFAASNARTEAITGLPLAELGYCISST